MAHQTAEPPRCSRWQRESPELGLWLGAEERGYQQLSVVGGDVFRKHVCERSRNGTALAAACGCLNEPVV